MVPEPDLLFLGAAAECREIEERVPRVLALPVFGRGWNPLAVSRELWCLHAIPEVWLSESDAVRPTLPRLAGHLLMKLAAYPEWPASSLLAGTADGTDL
jgi:hypothetical protein